MSHGNMGASTITVVFCYSASLLIALVLAAILLFSVVVYRARSKYGHIPSPKGESFFLGHIPYVNHMMKKMDLGMTMLTYQWMRDLGPVFYVRILHKVWVFCHDADAVKAVVLDSRHPKPQWQYDYFHSVFGERFMGLGLVSETNHEAWRAKRMLLNPAFKRSYLMCMMDKFNESAEGMCGDMAGKADGKTLVPMLDVFNDVALNVLAKAGFNLDPDLLKTSEFPLGNAASFILKGMNESFINPLMEYDPRRRPRLSCQRVRDACRRMRTIGRECIEERIAARQRGDELPNDILTCILNTSNKDSIDQEEVTQMVDNFTTFFIAGMETTSNLLAFCLLQIGRHEDVAKRLVQEVDDVLGSKPFIEYADLGKLEYMSRVLKETLRLYPPVGGTSRELACDVMCSGYNVPKGATVTFLTYLTARREEYFDDPLLFNPDRFLVNDQLDKPNHLCASFPFSIGQRNCIGQHMALIEAKVVLGKLLQRFVIRLEQSQRFIVVDEITNKPLDRCKNYISIRDN